MATIDLEPTLVSRLEHLAQSEGVTLQVYLERLASRHDLELANSSPLSLDELTSLLDAEASTDTAYQGTYPRSEIYRDHD
jgi:hypothetical protein